MVRRALKGFKSTLPGKGPRKKPWKRIRKPYVITVDFKKICINPGFKILDVGCGSGRHTCAASRLGDIFAIGSDIKFDEVKETRKRLLFEKKLGVQNGSRWAAFVADITALPFKDKAFDLVICSEVLEHVPMHETAAV